MLHEDVEQFGNFLFTLEWLLEVSARYDSNIHFHLVHVDFGSPHILGETYGAQAASLKLHEVQDALGQTLRKTDLVARHGVDFWIIMPSDPSIDPLSTRLREIIEVASQCGLEIVGRDISFFSLKQGHPELGLNCSGMDFLAYLKHNHSRLALHELELPAQN
ncbi:diguanylate cyclase [Azospira sp. APE16]|jgi:hypothetical protein|uniref:GGDEF domain-containing protein n=2 Tax=Azospira oryzae TaxID=146939 RepID=G8QFM9_AZOOP|nr:MULTISPECIES: diguanylate cyclase [Azospira]TLS19098.1 MAG: diguanylate cyclase [Betaproteobacteria bacterium]AEV27142.1 GGDEF domain-containing protein [Azospira oryzae PS]MDK9691604.1 diguanylate cyclase [Azospira sp.]RZT90041.1 diguanylate cyclase with GGDEF domain [Azospira oryzae]BBN87494.1 hypothetical protein AZSP09_05170 [Azospira sp. I09]